jgi:HEAT repeat protein
MDTVVPDDDTGFDSTLRALRDRDVRVRRQAACALGHFGDNRAVEPLVAALRDPGMEVAWCALRSLGALRDQRALAAIITVLRTSSDIYCRQAAADALGQFDGPEPSRALLDALKDPSPFVRRDVARALGRIGDSLAVPALRQVAEQDAEPTNRSGSTGVRDAAMHALRQIEERQH